MATSTMIETPFSSPSDSAPTTGWSAPDSDIHHLLNLPADMESFTGNEFEFTPGFSAPASLSPDDQSPSGLQGMDQVSISENYSSLLGLQSSGPVDSAPILLPPSPTRTHSAQGLSDNSHSTEHLSTPTTSSSLSPGQKCGCLWALLYVFEDTGVQITSSRDVATDTLFQCLQRGVQECQAMLSCRKCDTRVRNPILLATLGNQLVAIARELVTRFIQCQTGETAPVVFQFGRYSINGTGMQTRMLRDMVALHVRDLYDLLHRSRLNIDAIPGPLSILENAKMEVNKLQEILSQSLESISSNYS
ncbi:hypothetical protein F5Y00DRAFT_262068 [Daldinia vernicosa]|uniref:uncharacterized protein n=1 Tax=Daldinia vernicosa TaxID=114800 RepID=UPI0020086137|nr:uncharacterized protein F5Y00DRAFT_262068 [Daldinia vernicosa]KAI0848912.1 hypothetical protein F5Y00DRAFT_262068 [Daldinia vernicosa]